MGMGSTQKKVIQKHKDHSKVAIITKRFDNNNIITIMSTKFWSQIKGES